MSADHAAPFALVLAAQQESSGADPALYQVPFEDYPCQLSELKPVLPVI
jgi:hypothetical protein